MKAADLMTSFVVTVRPDATIEYAAQLMLQYRISGLPVTDSDGAVLGIVTESDLLRRAETGTDKRHARWVSLFIGPGRLAQEYVHTHARKVGEVMTERVFSVGPETPVTDLVALMETKHVKRVPVVDRKRLVGIVSRADVMAVLVGLLAEKPAGAVTDGEIRHRILAEIDRQPWGPRGTVDVIVTNGVVVLKGTIPDERERAALRVVAENVPGVKAVHDRLVWIDSVSGIVIPRP
ncbi:MAG: CBS domain-containing protein [Alphaproteobacteria bacterium]|nr:CBS domain-containing protein [Alphaproteobacteria bacterium]